MRKCYKLVIPVCLLIIIMSSCVKDEFTLPASTDLIFRVTEDEIMTNVQLEFLYLNISSVKIEGRRPVGENLFTSFRMKDLDEEEGFVVYPYQAKQINMDLPSGPYDQLRFSFLFYKAADEEGLLKDINDWKLDDEEDPLSIEEDLGQILEDYLDDLNPSLLLKAKYNQNGKDAYIVFVLNDVFELNTSLFSQGSSDISLLRNTSNQIAIRLDPKYWFSLITPNMLEKAIKADIDGEKYIFIHKRVNESLFTTINNRIEESTRLSVNGE